MKVELVTVPGESPVTLAEAKQHCRVDTNADDALIQTFIDSATDLAQAELQRAIITQTQRVYLDGFDSDEIELPYPKLQSVSSVKYYDTNGVLQTLSPSAYFVDSKALVGKVMLASGASWPATADRPNAVEIEFVCGYGAAAAVPKCVKVGILHLVAHCYEHRESVITGTIVSEVPQTFAAILRPEKIVTFS